MSRRIKFGVFTFLLSAVLVTCGVMIDGELLSRQKEKEVFEELAKLVTVEKSTASPAPSSSPIASMTPDNTDVPEESPTENEPAQRDLSELFAMNEDFVGWLCIPDTDINYPVVHTPGDPEKYLRRNFQGEYSESGVPFLDFRCSLDSDNLIIYGHNMMNGTMFAGLHKYGDSEYLEEHPYIYIYTEEGLLAYEIFAAYQSGDEHILYAHDGFEDRKVYGKYLEEILNMRSMGSVLKEGAEVTEDSRIITLSTCISGKPDNRFLVQGVLLNGDW